MHYSKVSRHDSGTRHPEKMKIETGDDSAMEGRVRIDEWRSGGVKKTELRRVRIPGSDSATRGRSPAKPVILAMSETEWDRSEGLSVIATKGDDRA